MAYDNSYTAGKNVDVLFDKADRAMVCAEGPERMGSPIAIHSGQNFKWGGVLTLLWSEPRGSPEIYRAKNAELGGFEQNQISYRYITVDTKQGSCICAPIITNSSQGTFKLGTETKDHTMIYNGNTTAGPTSDNRSASEIERGRKRSDKCPGLDFHDEICEGIMVLGMTGAGKSTLISSLCSQKDSGDLYDIASPMLIDTPGIGQQIRRSEGIGHKEDIQEYFNAQDGKYGKWKICHTCGLQKYGYDIDRAQYHEHGNFRLSPKSLAVLGLGSGLVMGVSFLWLSASMGLNETSSAMDWIIKESLLLVPKKVLQPLGKIPDAFRFCTFVLATAVFTGTAFVWASKMSRLASKVLGLAVIVMILVGSTVAGVTTEELLIVCLPSSLGVVMLLHSPFGMGREKALLVDEEQ